MSKIPKFLLYGEKDPRIEESIQPRIALRRWGELNATDKKKALQYMINNGWLNDYSDNILHTIEYLNHHFLRICPGNNLHQIPPKSNTGRWGVNESERKEAANNDFKHIFLNDESDAIVLRMLTRLAHSYIDGNFYSLAEKQDDEEHREELIITAFKEFDRLTNCLNHIFEQFSVNQILTRNGLVPRQDEKITEEIYIPTLDILCDPKWRTVSENLAKMFEDYRDQNYSEAITKAHSTVQRFLQILVGLEGKSGKGEVGKLFGKAKQEGIIPVNRFTEPLIGVIQGFISSERANRSTAKPSLKDANSTDALLMMNIVMVFLQHCLQKPK